MVANGHLESPIGTVELKFEVADFEFRERFIMNENIATSVDWIMLSSKKQCNISTSDKTPNIPLFVDAANAWKQPTIESSYGALDGSIHILFIHMKH